MDDKLLDLSAQVQALDEALVDQIRQNVSLRAENAKLRHALRVQETDAADVQSQDA